MDLSAKKRSRNYLDSHKTIEKRRRDRINNYLETIKSLLPIYDHLPAQKRLDKADILDMTVVYLQMVNTFLESLGVQDIFCAIHQQLSLLNSSEIWIRSKRDEYDSISSFVDAFSIFIRAEHRRSYKVLAKAVDAEKKSKFKPYFTDPKLTSNPARACCTQSGDPDSDRGVERTPPLEKETGKAEPAKIKHLPFARSLSEIVKQPERPSGIQKEDGKNQSVKREMEAPNAGSGRQSGDTDVSLVELLKRKLRPEVPQPSTHSSRPHSSFQGYWMKESEVSMEVSHPQPSESKIDHGFTMQAQNIQSSTIPPNGRDSSSFNYHKRRIFSPTAASGRPEQLNIQQFGSDQNEVTILDCVSQDGRVEVNHHRHHNNDNNNNNDDDITCRVDKVDSATSSRSQGCGPPSRKKCHCNFKVSVRDQGMNTEKSRDNGIKEKELMLKVDAGQIELDLGSLLRRAQAKDDSCVVPITFRGSLSVNVADSDQNKGEGKMLNQGGAT